MTDFLIQATLSNFVVASILAVVAWVVQRQVRSASLSNLLWALVLIKLITPPLVSIPVLEVPSISSSSVLQTELSSALTPPMGLGIVELGNGSIAEKALIVTSDATKQSNFAAIGMRNVTVSLIVWLVISGILFVISAFRIFRFHRLLKATSSVHDNLSNGLSIEVAKQLGIKVHPNILVTQANIAPFVWWKAGRSVIVVPIQASQELCDDDLRLVITHEMAHIKRRDHWFRWLEWLALIGLWWNPVMWWARHQMRISEEMACDDLVLETVAQEVHQYGNALLNMVELLTAAAIRPPVVASAINSGGCLEQRLKMMISDKTRKVPTSMRIAIVITATCVFPLGVVYAQDLEAIKRRLSGAIEAGELSTDQAELMMEALRRPSRLSDQEAMERQVARIKQELQEAIEAGKISKQDAEKKLDRARRELQGPSDDHGDQEAMERQVARIKKELKEAVEAGKISKQDAVKKFDHVRREMLEPSDDHGDPEAMERRVTRIKKELQEAVEAGKISKQDAEKKLDHARREMQGPSDDHGDQEAMERRVMRIKQELQEAVEAGKISKQDAEKKLDHVRRELQGPSDDHGDKEAMERWLMEIKEELNEAIEAGKISKQDAEKKLDRARRELQGPSDDHGDQEAMERQVARIKKELKEAVEAGKISKQDAEKKLDHVRREMLGPSERGDKKQ